MKYRGIYKILVCVLALIMAMSATSIVSFAAVWSGGMSSVIPAQSNDGFYLIESAEDLAWFANQINSDAGNVTMKGRLLCDIYLNDVENADYSKVWTPIADYSTNGRTYSGIFDGKGYTIYGLRVNSSNDYQGLFGYLSGAQIKNLNLSSAMISGASEVGAIAGYSDNTSSITSCTVNADIIGDTNVGGITGYLINNGNISNCAFSGSIKATGNRVGGISGCVAFSSTVSQSYNLSSVYSSGKFVGGICGTNSGGIIISCYNRGTVSGSLRVAGISGNNVGDVSCCYNASNVLSTTEPAGLTGAVVGYHYAENVTNCYYDATLYTGKEDYALAMESDAMMRHSFVDSLNEMGGNFYYDFILANNGYPILSWQADQNLWDGTVSEPQLSIDGKYYYINNPRELAWFAGLVNGTLEGVEQNTYADAMLMNSIVLNVGNLAEGSNVWTPIGDGGVEYNGEFVGNGFTVRGLYIPSGEVVGLFGTVSQSGSVSNITVAESYLSGTSRVGSIVGSNNGTVERTKTIYTTLIGDDGVGGIAGENGGSVINSSSVYANINAVTNAGGIVGENLIDAVVETCCSSSTVTAETNAGGISGKNSGDISFSFNSGEVTATDSYAGGITGRLIASNITNSYNKGTITATSKVGGIVGQLTERGSIDVTYSVGSVYGAIDANAIVGGLSSGSVSNSYFDKNKVNVMDSYAKALTTTQMTGNNSLDNMTGFSHQYWIATEDSDYFVYYPQLNTFATSGDFDLYDISVESVSYLKDGLICKVIDSNETSYFATLAEAMEKIGTGEGIIEILENMTLDTTANVTGNVTVIPANESIEVKRGKYFYDAPIVVNDGAVLSFGSDDVDYFALNLNGNNVNDITNQNFPESMIVVQSEGTLNIYDAAFTNCRALNGGVVSNNGVTNLFGGSYSDSTAVNNGGVVYNKGELNVYAAEIFNNNSKLAGGVIYNAGGEVNINTGADIHNNTSGEGGAFYVEKGSFNMLGGSVYSNSAPYGGAFYVGSNGKINLYDGSVYENSAAISGSGIYTVGTVIFYSSGNIDTSNDIYLPLGKTVTMGAKSAFSSSIAVITPEIYAEGLSVIEGDYTAMNASLCLVTPEGETSWHINSGGNLTTSEIKYVLTASFFQSDEVPYTSLEDAMEDIGENPAIITLIDDITISETVLIQSNITFESDGNPHTISAAEGFSGPMFEVVDSAVLSFGTSVDVQDDDVLFVDGTGVSADALILVESGATLEIYSGTVIYGADSIESAVKSVGTVEMYGGKVTENNTTVGAIYIMDGEFNFFSGTIFDNSNVGVYSNGTLNITDGAGVDESNTVFLTDGNVINVLKPEKIIISTEDPETGEIIEELVDPEVVIPNLIAKVDFEKYYVDSSVISSNEEDISKYTGKFTLADATYTLDENNIIRADNFVLKSTSSLNMTEDKIYGFSVNTYTAKALALQFENLNVAVMTKDGTIKGEDEKIGTGDMVVLLDESANDYRQLPILIYGDINGDGDVNGSDAFIVSCFVYGYLPVDGFTSIEIQAMDVNHDGSVTEKDVTIIENVGLLMGSVSQKPLN